MTVIKNKLRDGCVVKMGTKKINAKNSGFGGITTA
jgi:hypothetical protein